MDEPHSADSRPVLLCRICRWRSARPNRRDQRCPTCAAYYHRYHRDRSPELIARHGRRLLERMVPLPSRIW